MAFAWRIFSAFLKSLINQSQRAWKYFVTGESGAFNWAFLRRLYDLLLYKDLWAPLSPHTVEMLISYQSSILNDISWNKLSNYLKKLSK